MHRLKLPSYSCCYCACKHTDASPSLRCILNKDKHCQLHGTLVQLQPVTEPTHGAQTPPTPNTYIHTSAPTPPYQPFSSSSISDWVFSELHCKHHILPASTHQTRYSRTLVAPPPQQSPRAASTADPVHTYCLPPLLSPHGRPHFSWEPTDGRRSAGSDRQTQLFLIPLSPSLSSQCRAGLV